MNTVAGQVIATILKSINSNTYFDKAPVGTSFPYQTWKTPSSFYFEGGISIMLEVDLWDNKGNNIATLEQRTDLFRKTLQKYYYNDSNISLKFEFESLLHLDDEEQQIRRRQLRFRVKKWEV